MNPAHRRGIGVAAGGLLGYAALAWLGIALKPEGSDMAVFWPAAGFGGGLIYFAKRRGYSVAASVAAVFGGCLLANLERNALAPSLGFAGANATESLLFATMAVRIVNWGDLSTRTRDQVARVFGGLGAAVLAPTIAGAIGALVVRLAYGGSFLGTWLSWIGADAIGILIVAPIFILSAVAGLPKRHYSLAEAVGIELGLVGVGASVFFFGGDRSWLLDLLIPLFCVASTRVSLQAMARQGAVLAAVAALATAKGRGPFGGLSGDGGAAGLGGLGSHDALYNVQGFVVATYVAMFTLGLVSLDRRALLLRSRSDAALAGRIFDGSGTAIVLVDYRDALPRYRLVNAEMSRVFGVPRQSLESRERPPIGAHAWIHESDREVLARRESTWSEETVECVDGVRSFHTARFPLLDESGRPWAVYTAFRDITDFLDARERVVEQERTIASMANRQRYVWLEADLRSSQQFEYLGRVAGEIAHDFNNLLGVIQNYAAVLDSQVTDRGRADLERLREATERGSSLTRDLLAYGRNEPTTVEVIDLVELVDDVLEMMASAVGDRAEISFGASPVPLCIVAEREPMEQVVINLLVNALDATSAEGTVRIDLEPQREWVRLAVVDSGCGMAEAVRARAFDPFFTTKSHGQGSGMGLATVRRRIEALGGSVSIESAAHEGTTVEVILPRHSSADTTVRPNLEALPDPLLSTADGGSEAPERPNAAPREGFAGTRR